jgi:putative endopeptidase
VITLKDLDKTIRPQDDFFHFATGGWIRRNPIPAEKARWTTFDALAERSRKQLREIIESLSPNKRYPHGSNEQMVRDLWLSGMDKKRRNALGVAPLKPFLERVRAIQSREDLLPFISFAHRAGFNVLWSLYVGRDDKNSSRNILHLSQGGLSLPDRDYYLKQDAGKKLIRKQFLAHIERLLVLAGYSKKEARAAGSTVLRVETLLARASMSRTEMRDPHKLYNKRTLKRLAAEARGVAWREYLRQTKIGSVRELIASQPQFLAQAGTMVEQAPLEDLKTYFAWKMVDEMAPALTEAMAQENFRFYGRVLTGSTKMQPLWKRMVGVVDGTVGHALGQLYVKAHFDAHAKHRINTLVDNLFAAYHERLEALPWMSAKTKKKAFVKLRTMSRKLGYPDKWESYRGLRIEKNDYVGNLLRSEEYEFDRMVKKLFKKPDPGEWFMTPPTVNAYFHPNYNEIAFPAGIMQPPFFGANADDAYNYGGIGSVIGHEITHGFDDEGRKFDHKGNLKDWWSKDDHRRFEKRSAVIEKQFNRYVAIDNLRVNGKLTLGENIADLGGVMISYHAFKKSQEGKPRKIINGFTPEQRFFLGYALTEAGSIRPNLLKMRLLTDPHSPSIFRVNGPLSNIDEFYEAFAVRKGDKLYRAPAARAKIW